MPNKLMMQGLAHSESEIASETEVQLLSPNSLLSSDQLLSWSLQGLEWLGFVPSVLLKVSKRLAENPAVLLYFISAGAAALSQASRSDVNAVARTLPSALQNETHFIPLTSLDYSPVVSRIKRQAASVQDLVDDYENRLDKLVSDKKLGLADFLEGVYQLQDEMLSDAEAPSDAGSANFMRLEGRVENLLSHHTVLTVVSQQMKDIKELRAPLSEIDQLSLPAITADVRPTPEAYQAYRDQLDQDWKALKEVKRTSWKHKRNLKKPGADFAAQADAVKTILEEINTDIRRYIENYPLLTVQAFSPLQEEAELMVRIAGYTTTLSKEEMKCSLEVSQLKILREDIINELEKAKSKTMGWQNSAGGYSIQLQTLLKRTDALLVPKQGLFATDEAFSQMTLTSCSSTADSTPLQTRLLEWCNIENKASPWPSCYTSEIALLKDRVATHIFFEKELGKYTAHLEKLRTNVSAVPAIALPKLDVQTAMSRPDYVKLSGGCKNKFEQLTNNEASLTELRVFVRNANSRLKELGDGEAVSLPVDYLVALKREITTELESSAVKLSEVDKSSLEALLQATESFIAAKENLSRWQLTLDKVRSSTPTVELTLLRQEILDAMGKSSYAELSTGYQGACKDAQARVNAQLNYREFDSDNGKKLASPESLTIEALLQLKQALETFHKANFSYLPKKYQEDVSAWDTRLRGEINEKLPEWKELSAKFKLLEASVPDSTEPLSKLQEQIGSVREKYLLLDSCHTDLDVMDSRVAALKQAKKKIDEYKEKLIPLNNDFSISGKNLLTQIEESTTESTRYASVAYETLPAVYKLAFNSIWIQCRDLNVWQSRITGNKKQSDELAKVLDTTPLYLLTDLLGEIENFLTEETVNALSQTYRSELETQQKHLQGLIATWHTNDKPQTFNKILANNSARLKVILDNNTRATRLSELGALNKGLQATMDGSDYQRHANHSEFEKLKDRVDSLISILSTLQTISDSLTHNLSAVILKDANSDPSDKALKNLQDGYERLKNAVNTSSDLSASDKQHYAEAGRRIKHLVQIRSDLRKADDLIQREKEQDYNPDLQTELEQSHAALKHYAFQDSDKQSLLYPVNALQARLSSLDECIKFKQKINAINQDLITMENDFDFQTVPKPVTNDSIAQARQKIRSFFPRGDMPESYQKEFKRVFDRWSVLTGYRSAIRDYKNELQRIINGNVYSPLFHLENLQDEINDLTEDPVVATLPAVDRYQLRQLAAELEDKVNLEKNKEGSLTIVADLDRAKVSNNPNIKTRSLKRMKRALESLLEGNSAKRAKRSAASSSQAPIVGVSQEMSARHKKRFTDAIEKIGSYISAGKARDQIRNATEKVEQTTFAVPDFSSEVAAVRGKLDEVKQQDYYQKIAQSWKNKFNDFNDTVNFLESSGRAIIEATSVYESYKTNATLEITAITAKKDFCLESVSKVITLTDNTEYALPTNYQEAFRDCENKHSALVDALKKITEFNGQLEKEKNQETFPSASSELVSLKQVISSWYGAEKSSVSMFEYCRSRVEQLEAEIQYLIKKHEKITSFSTEHTTIQETDNEVVTGPLIETIKKLIERIDSFLDPNQARSDQEAADDTSYDLPPSYREKADTILKALKARRGRSLQDLGKIHETNVQELQELLDDLKNNSTYSLSDFIKEANTGRTDCNAKMEKDTHTHLSEKAQADLTKQCDDLDNYVKKAKELEGIIKAAKAIREHGCPSSNSMDEYISVLKDAERELDTFMQDTGYADLPKLLKKISEEFKKDIPIVRNVLETINNATDALVAIKAELQRSLDEQENFVSTEKTRVQALSASIKKNKLTLWYHNQARSLEHDFNDFSLVITELKKMEGLKKDINAYQDFLPFGIAKLAKFINAMKAHATTLDTQINSFYEKKYPAESAWAKTQIEKFGNMKERFDTGVAEVERFKEFLEKYEDVNTEPDAELDKQMEEKVEEIAKLLTSTVGFEDIPIIKQCYDYIQQRLKFLQSDEAKAKEAQAFTERLRNDPNISTAEIVAGMEKFKGYLGEEVDEQGQRRARRSVGRVCCNSERSARTKRSIEGNLVRQEAIKGLNFKLRNYTSDFKALSQKSSVDIPALEKLIAAIEPLSTAADTPPAYQTGFSELLEKVKRAKEKATNEKVDLEKARELEELMLHRTKKDVKNALAGFQTLDRWTNEDVCNVIGNIWKERSFSGLIVAIIDNLGSSVDLKIDAFHCLLEKMEALSQPNPGQLADIKDEIMKLKPDASSNPEVGTAWDKLLARAEALLAKENASSRSKRQVSRSCFFSEPSNLPATTVEAAHEQSNSRAESVFLP